jgi:hypothetical protein
LAFVRVPCCRWLGVRGKSAMPVIGLIDSNGPEMQTNLLRAAKAYAEDRDLFVGNKPMTRLTIEIKAR